MIFLDSASFYPTLPVAKEAYLNAPFGNPSSEHAVGHRARSALEGARKKIAKCIGAEPEDRVIFTSGATESCQWAMQTLFDNCAHVYVGETEHHAVSEYRCVKKERSVRELFKSGCAQMLGQNEVGTIFDVSRLQKKYELVFSDATAAVGHIPVDVTGVDLMAFAGHKFGGVPGVGVLYAKDPSILFPLIRGGGQERGMRSGTENVPAICAMAAALEWQTEHMEENTRKLSKLRDIFISAFAKMDNVLINTPLDRPNLPHILNASFMVVDNHALTLMLSQRGVMVSPGAACSNGLNEPSHVLMAMFHDEQRARSAIRISLSHENTEEECVEAARIIRESVEYLRGIV